MKRAPEVYEAPMDDDMLLGLDLRGEIMYSWTAINNRFIINSDTFHLSYGKSYFAKQNGVTTEFSCAHQ